MEERKHLMHRGYDIGRQLSIALAFGGVLFIVIFLGNQFTRSLWPLFVGAGCVLFGILFLLLFSILIRLDRVEAQISENPEACQETDRK